MRGNPDTEHAELCITKTSDNHPKGLIKANLRRDGYLLKDICMPLGSALISKCPADLNLSYFDRFLSFSTILDTDV